VDGLLNIIFQGAFNCAKLTKTNSKISNTPVSIGTLTANAIQDYLDENGGGRVLVIGATGKTGSIVAKNLLDKGIKVTGTARKHPSDELLCQTKGIEWIDYHKRYEYMGNAAVVVSATTSPHYTVTMERFLECLKSDTKSVDCVAGVQDDVCELVNEKETRTLCGVYAGYEKKLMIDLAVPCDIDKEIADVSGVKLLDIDYFNTLSKENGNIRTGEADKVKHIINECVEELLKKLYIRKFQKSFISEKENDKEIEKEGLPLRMAYYLKDVLDSGQLCAVLEKIYEKENGE
jgi:glutamyl-tRNA reductase